MPTVFSDRHAYLQAAQFYTSLDDLKEIDWDIPEKRDFRREVDDLGETDRYQAEALIHTLIHRHLPVEHLQA